MFISILTDELGIDATQCLPLIKAWGLDHVDLRMGVYDMNLEDLPAERLPSLRKLFDSHGIKVGCLLSSLAKIHLPDAERRQAEARKLENMIRAADALDCRLVRVFHYWQPPPDLLGALTAASAHLQKVLDLFAPLAKRAKETGLILAFENCGVMPDEILAVLDALNEPTWGLAWDVCNTWDCAERRQDEDVYIRRLARRALSLQVKATGAVPGYGEPIPYDKILRACQNAGLPGPISVETYNPARQSVSHVDMTHRVVKAIQMAWPTTADDGITEAPKPKTAVRPWRNNPVGFVVVGLGVGQAKSKEILQTPGTRLVGVCDLNEELARRVSEECHVPYTVDFRSWLDNDEVEVVFVLTETGHHADIGLQALTAGKHVLVTKPMAASLAACDDMIRLAEKRGLLLAMDIGTRFGAGANTLKAAVAKKRFGRLLSGNVAMKLLRNMGYYRDDTDRRGNWRGTWRMDGGGVMSIQGVYHIDEIAYTIGIPSKVRCDIWTQAHDIEAEDLAAATWLYDDGLVITFFATSSYPQDSWYSHYELQGTEGAYFRAGAGPFPVSVTKWFLNGVWSDQPPEVVELEWINAPDNFAAAVRAGAALTCSGRDGRRSQAILDAMYRSARDAGGNWVDVCPELEPA